MTDDEQAAIDEVERNGAAWALTTTDHFVITRLAKRGLIRPHGDRWLLTSEGERYSRCSGAD